MATDKAGAASAAARQRALEEARRRAAEQARKAAEAKAAAAAKQAQAKAKLKGFGTDDLSTGKGGALRRAATSKLGARGLEPAKEVAPTGKTFSVSEMKALAGTGPDATRDAASIARVKDPADRAKALQDLVTKNPDPVYRHALLDAAKPSIEEVARQVVDKKSGVSTQARQQALDSLAKTTELLDSDSQKQLAQTFAGTMKNQNVGDDDNEFGTMLKNSVKDGSGASFGVRLASELQASGKTTAANDSSKFIGQGISDVKKDFDEASKKSDELHLHLAQELSGWKLSGVDQTKALAEFSKNNHLKETTAELEKQGALLSSTLAGSAIAESDPVLKAAAAEKQAVGRGGMITKYSNEADLLGASKDALSDVPALANTKAGATAISDAVARGGEGKQTFLDQAKEDIGDAKKGAKALLKLRSAVVQSVGAHLLSAAADGNFEAEKAALLKGLEGKAALFGTGAKQMKAFTDSLAEFKPGMTEAELNAATQAAGSKISALGTNDSAVAQSLKGLTVVFGTIAAVKDWTKFSQADVQQKIATISNTLTVGKQGADLITGTLSRFASTAAVEGSEGAEAAAIGLTAGKLVGAGVGALATVVSGWQAVNDFSKGNIEAGVGESLTAIGGAVATAGLFLDGTIAGAPAGVVLNIAGGVLAAAGVVVGLFQSPPNPFEGQEEDLGKILQALGVKKEVADKLEDFNSKGQNFGTWVHAVAGKLNLETGDFVRSMNTWSPQQVTDFLDAARLQHDTDDNNGNRRNNASKVLGKQTADALEDPEFVDFQTGKVRDKLVAQQDLREVVDEKTGEITYDAALVDRAAQWVRDGLPT